MARRRRLPGCGDACKRSGLPEPPFVYVGDGYSDHCPALAAERIFASDGLARYLYERAVPTSRSTTSRTSTVAK